MQRRHFLLTGILAVAACVPSDQRATTRLIVLRHADRDADAVELNVTGHARAAALPAALAGYEIDAIYVPDRLRNHDTAAPLAAGRGLTPEIIDTARIATTLWRAAAGRTIVWIGNSTNLRELWNGLGAPGDPPLAYGEIVVLSGTSRNPTNRSDLRYDP